MDTTNIDLTPAEWNLMECLWEKSPRTGKEAVDFMKASVGWSRSTTLTMLRRMNEKGLVDCHPEDGMQTFSPRIRREDALMRETTGFLNRVYHGSVSMMLSAFTRKQALSPEEIEELYAILEKAREGSSRD